MADCPSLVTVKPLSNGTGPRKTRMHRLIEEDGIVLMPGIYDALSAAVLQSLGYKAGFVSGYAVSASRLGLPDIGLLTYVDRPQEISASPKSKSLLLQLVLAIFYLIILF